MHCFFIKSNTRCCIEATSLMAVVMTVQVIAMKAPGFGERKSSYLEDIAILTGAQVIKDELGLTLDKVSIFTCFSLPSTCHAA